MAQIHNKTHDTKPKNTTCSLGCFGFSHKTVPDKKCLENNGSGSRKKIRWFSWSRFRMKKSATKTVPVDAAVSDKANQNIENQKPKSGKHVSRRQIPAVVVSDKRVVEKPQKTRYGPEQSIILENRKNLDHLDSTKDDTCKKRLSFSRKIESIRTSVSHPGSPETTKPKSAGTNVVAPPASSARTREKKTVTTINTRIHREIDVGVKKFDPMIGMSIIMVTLIIMVFWGRLCAILCTAAWFYFVPRLRASAESKDTNIYRSNLADADINSEEYKKKVVLEGFLERNRRSSIGIL